MRVPVDWARTFAVRARLGGLLAGGLSFGLLSLAGAGGNIEATLGAMGFDADRARLITTLLTGAAGASAAGFSSRGWQSGVALSLLNLIAGFGLTFIRESQAALTPPTADFDPLGWGAVLTSLVLAGFLVGWASATLAGHARGGVDATLDRLRVARHHPARRLGGLRELGTLMAVLVSLAVGLPTLGTIFNYGPDAPMHRAGPAFAGILTAAASPASLGGAESAPVGSLGSALRADGALVPGPLPGSSLTSGATSALAPWAAGPPLGAGHVVLVQFPAPWSDGPSRTATVDIYLPAGYDSSSTQRYPVVYSAPWGIADWNGGMQLASTLDRLIGAGTIPPQIFVFISQRGALYASSECANARDGRQWFERYVLETVIPFVDGHYRTIAGPGARSLLGYSEGGYCTAVLLLRHPDQFRQAAAISGYYRAAPRSGATSNAWRVFGNDPGLIAAASPSLLVGSLPVVVRSSLFVVLVGQPSEPFFGSEYTDFASALALANVPRALFPLDGGGHSWGAVRASLGAALAMLAARQVHEGVFGPLR